MIRTESELKNDELCHSWVTGEEHSSVCLRESRIARGMHKVWPTSIDHDLLGPCSSHLLRLMNMGVAGLVMRDPVIRRVLIM